LDGGLLEFFRIIDVNKFEVLPIKDENIHKYDVNWIWGNLEKREEKPQ